jgi:glycosyltransferase involved in cell wall biosynthesis
MKKPKLVHINYSDVFGGSAKLAQSVINSQSEIESSYLCARPVRTDSKLLGWGIGGKAGIGLKVLHKVACMRNSWFGDTAGILDGLYLRQIANEKPDVIHIHNIHGSWFSLRLLPKLLAIAPVVWTIHDEWAYTGHCVATFGCEKWRQGCGDCPSLQTMIALKRDTTAKNWERRNDIYHQIADDNIAMVAVSHWLGERIRQSGIWPGRIEVIPNGVDTKAFYPIDREVARRQLGIAENAKVLLYIAQGGIANPFKNGLLFYNMLNHLPGNKKFQAVVLGGPVGEYANGSKIPIISPGYISDERVLRMYYSAADLLVYPTRADTFGLVVSEAMACGTPVLATRVGGVTEQIIEGQNGFLVDPDIDEESLAERIVSHFSKEQDGMCNQDRIASCATRRYSNERMGHAYSNLYVDMIKRKDRS